jgi:DNA gyrase/topoisomerase IV subunit A
VLKNRVGKDWEVEDPLLMMNVRRLHPSYLAFFAWLDQRLDANSVLILVQHKKKLLAVPVDAFREAGRGGLGRSIGDLKYEKAFHCRSRSVLVFTASGWVHRIPSEWIPVIGQPEAEFKVEIRRGDRIAAVLDEPGAEELLILISEKGRVKAVPRDDFRRFPAEGARCLGLEEKDNLALAVAARFDGTPLAVFSRKGRALRLPMDSIRLKSRQARGVIQLRFQEEQDGPVAAFQLSDEDPYLVASPDGRVKAGLGGLVPLRLNGGSGVIVARGQVAGAASLICAGIGLLSRGGRLLVFSSEELRILSRGARGVKGLALRGNDRLDFVFST